MAEGRHFSILLHLWISLITTGIECAYYSCVIFFDEKCNFCKISKLVHSLTAYLMKWIIEFEIFSDDLMRLVIDHDFFFLQLIQYESNCTIDKDLTNISIS